MPRQEAYETGIRKISDVLAWCMEEEIPMVTMWGFSTENFQRDSEEVSSLFGLFEKDLFAAITRKDELLRKDVRVRFLGRTSLFPEKITQMFNKVEEMTKGATKYSLNLLLAYGGRAEIVDAVNSALNEGATEVTEEMLSKHMYTAGLPDPDLVIRTSGAKRLSGLLPWQTVYSEIYFVEKLWPDFSRGDFGDALRFYEMAQRRFGK
ncbi:di-trans,poly-cis-decaprenylcistransferase [Candidatus Micrarchaeota archaeon]|nr:di-trans,poly-cis-decaprenylcistransferase [Candidatus Micrarchaeota archaeon]MBD3417677.1 di-trans,poly-cis-decaprenylcistransferase [Candidatus Micrarchaeota archaeon]